MRSKRPSGSLIAVTGASQSGKSTWVANAVASCTRLLVWDYKAEWYLHHHCRRLESWVQLADCVHSHSQPERIAYCAPAMNRAAFDVFCRFAWIWLRRDVGTLVIEETASVTSPGKAPDAWGDVCRMGLGFGATIYAVTQRPAESDKTALGNASLIHCHRMATDDDARYMAKLLRVPQESVDALRPYDWIERTAAGELRKSGPSVHHPLRKPSRKTATQLTHIAGARERTLQKPRK
jgi:hypothetical protein